MNDLQRLLVRLPNWLGDVLLARPLLHALRRSFPRAELCAVAPASLLELLEADRAYTTAHPWPAAGAGRAALARQLERWGPAAALVLPPSFSSAWFAWQTRARARLGYRAEARDLLLTRRFTRPPRGDRHLSDEYLELGRALGAAAQAPPPTLELPIRAREAATRLLSDTGTSGDFAVIGPGATYGPAKRWPAARFAELGRALAGAGLEVLACGAPGERDTCEAVAGEIGPGARSLAGRTDLLAQAGLCAAARVAVCNDSGLAHLSAALGTPTVVVFGSTSSAWTAPLGPRVRVVQDAPVCSPCFQRVCSIGTVCLEAVTTHAVERAWRELVAERTPTGTPRRTEREGGPPP